MTDASQSQAPLARDEKVSFSKEPQHSTLVYERTAPVEVQLEELDALHLHDKRTEAKRKTLLIWMWIVGVPGLMIFPLTFGVSLLPLLFVWLRRQKLANDDLEDRRLHAARFVLETLAPELRARPFPLHLDFGAAHKAPPRIDVLKGSGAPSYERPWLRMELPLLDGSTMRVSASTRLKRKERRKRKYTRIKERLYDELNIDLYVPSGHAPAVSADELRKRFDGPRPLRLTSCRVSPRRVTLGFRTEVAQRMRFRDGWHGQNLEALLEGRKVLDVIIASHAGAFQPSPSPVAA